MPLGQALGLLLGGLFGSGIPTATGTTGVQADGSVVPRANGNAYTRSSASDESDGSIEAHVIRQLPTLPSDLLGNLANLNSNGNSGLADVDLSHASIL